MFVNKVMFTLEHARIIRRAIAGVALLFP